MTTNANTTYTCTLDELDDILGTVAAPREPLHAWVVNTSNFGDVHDLRDEELCELAAERDERGTAATVAGVLQALRVRHADDRVTLAMLAALEDFHLPALRDEMRGA